MKKVLEGVLHNEGSLDVEGFQYIHSGKDFDDERIVSIFLSPFVGRNVRLTVEDVES